MKFIELSLNGAYLIQPKEFRDNRGVFSRLFCKREFALIGHKKEVVQINHSVNFKAGTLRGMHFQKNPMAETKIVKCVKGSVFDVIVDLRQDSPTLLQWHAERLSVENMRMLYIPEGFAHGFQVLETNSELLYFHCEFYSPDSESAIRYDDPLVDIKWPMPISEISERDLSYPLLPETFNGFKF